MKQSKYTRDLLEPIVRESLSIARVLQLLGLRPTGGNYRLIQSHFRRLGISTDHFHGMGWSRGKTKETHTIVAQIVRRNTRPDEDVFVENSPETCGYRLGRRLQRMGWKYSCAVCGLVEWQGRPLRLHLDHKNGVNSDNRLENLQLLCPNCHSQTGTYCRKKTSKNLAR
jgi:5-methylcytosine-specific restriction endonuclease McrA